MPTTILQRFISHKIEKIQEKEISVNTGNFILDTIKRWIGRQETRIDIGGKAAMKLACALGLTLKMLYDSDRSLLTISTDELNKNMKDNLKLARDKLNDANEYDELDEILNKVRSKHKAKRRKMLKRADELYYEIRYAFD